LFSNSLAPPIVSASLRALELLTESTELRDKLMENTRFFREQIANVGYDVLPGEHPIVPIMIYDAALANRTADALLERGIYVIGFSFPVVPRGKARIRTQISAAHSRDDLAMAIEKFAEVRRELARCPRDWRTRLWGGRG
jgi:glycine C-acetyltransferase